MSLPNEPVRGRVRVPTGSASVPSAAGRASVSVPGSPGMGRAAVKELEKPAGPGQRSRNRPPLSPDLAKKLKKKRRRRKITLISLLIILLLIVGGMGAGYAAVQVPLPSLQVLKQAATVYYSDGTTQLARLGVNRDYVKIKDIPKRVQQAVVAAEDRSFWKNDGISIRGIMRAMWANITGNEVQGASTITQQYVKNAFLSQERTFSRKTKEIVLAVKMDKEYSKDQILEYYLNTIYFGRGAYGIETAAKAYYGVSAKDLTTEQAAFIAGIIKAPVTYEPDTNKLGAQKRWNYVINAMASEGWYNKAKLKTAQFPQPLSKAEAKKDNGLGGVSGTIMTRIQDELIANGFSEQQIRTGGLRITTTIDPAMQQAMDQSVDTNMKGQKEGLGTAMAAVEPGTGRVKAYYGGTNGFGGFDYAGPDSPHPAGSSFKSYVLATALEQGVSINSKWDGSSPQTFPDRSKPVRNSDNAQCPVCTLEEATVRSLNTPYYALTMKVGAKAVTELAERAGITELDHKPADEFKNEVSNNIGVGQYAISVLDHAAGFATFAANGLYAKPHFVEKVEQEGSTVYEANIATQRAFDKDVAATATYVLEKVVNASSKNKLAGGRRAAGKTGTHQYLDTGHNAHVWMCGYTPQLATAVWVGNLGNDGPVYESNGKNMYGSGLPGKLWKTFMDKALQGKSKEKFPAYEPMGDDDAGNAHEPEPSPTPEDSGPGFPTPTQPDPGNNGNGNGGFPKPGHSTEPGLGPNFGPTEPNG